MAADNSAKPCTGPKLRYNAQGFGEGQPGRISMGLAERRRESRATCRVEVQCAGSDSLFRGTLLNLSATGGYLETAAAPPPEGAGLTLLWRAGARKVQVDAVVAWSHASGSIGVRFVDRLPAAVVRDSRQKS